MYETTATPKALRLRRSVARKARVALAATVVAAALVLPPLVAGLVAPPAHAATTTFVVKSTGDQADVKVGDGVCDSTSSGSTEVCTLRAAIQEASSSGGTTDVIDFAIPSTDRGCDATSGVCTIAPASALPAIHGGDVTIDGYSQPGAHPNTLALGNDALLKIELDGTKVTNSSGLVIGNSSNDVIRGLVINRFGGTGIGVVGSDAAGNRIEGNFLGTDPSGTVAEGDQLNGVAILDGASQNVVGGTTPEERNVISGGNRNGVFLVSDANRVQGNYIGADESGTKDLGNTSRGVLVRDASGTTVGGTTAGARNVISGNNFDGVTLDNASGSKVVGNRIGTTASGTAALGNFEGVHISNGATNNSVGDGTLAGSNTIAFNDNCGVFVTEGTSTGNAISRNSIFSNGDLGIDLNNDGVTPNDSLDVDSGPNGLQNKPSLGSAKTVSGTTTVKGTLSSEAGKSYKIEFYSNPSGDEGKKFIGQKSVTTGADGKAAFTFTPSKAVSVGQAITATATNATSGSPHETSEFSAPRTVASS